MSISLIVAMGENGVIGAKNRMPWHLSADLRHFRQITMGKPILMGRKTHQSIGRPLPGRLNIVLSRDQRYSAEGCVIATSLDEAVTQAGDQEIMIIGGAALYESFLPLTDRLYLTLIHHSFDGDTFFPKLDWADWRVLQREDIDEDLESGLRYSFLTLERVWN
ncbi:MAG: dihydrofolate reductase [Methylococcaceae bacterium]|jgi:dihydrofolate reductase